MMQNIPPRTLILLVLTVIVAVFGLTLSFKSTQKMEVSSQRPQTQITLGEISVDVETQNKLSLLKEAKKRLEEADWANDPFVAGEGSLFLIGLSSFKVTGIILDPKCAYAVINDEIVKVEDTIGGWKVTEILPNKVILEKDGEEFSLHLWEE